MKRLTAILLVLALLLGMSGCGGCGKQHALQTLSGTPGPTQEPPAVWRLQGFDADGEMTAMIPADSSRVVLQYGAMQTGDDPETNLWVQKLALYDIDTDRLVSETEMRDGWEEQLLGVRRNGEILTYGAQKGILNIYGEDLLFDRTVTLPEEFRENSVRFDRETDILFCSLPGKLFCVSADGETVARLSLEGRNVEAFDPGSGIAVCLPQDEAFMQDRTFTVYDTADGTELYTGESLSATYALRGGQLTVCSCRPLPDEETGIISQHRIVTVFSEDLSAQTAFDLGDRDGFEWENGAYYAVSTQGRDDGGLVPVFIDCRAKTAAQADLGEERAYRILQCNVPGESLYLVASETGTDTDIGHMNLYIVDPARLSFTQRMADALPETTENVQAQILANREFLRAAADSIEEDFHVTVLLGDECAQAEWFGYTFDSTDAPGADTSCEVSQILLSVRRHLETFPKGYFDTFRNDEGECGLRYLIVKDLYDTYNPGFIPGGCMFQVWDWYNIALDMDEYIEYSATVAHETWHAVEMYIFIQKTAAFDSWEWNQLNPPGFEEYTYDPENYYDAGAGMEAYLFGEGDDPYFARNYSLVGDNEDRATLIELLYNRSLADTPAESAEAMRAYPHLRAKLDFMAERVREFFGTVYWEEADGA